MKTNNKKLKTQELKKEIHSFSKKRNHQAHQTSSCVLLLFLAGENELLVLFLNGENRLFHIH